MRNAIQYNALFALKHFSHVNIANYKNYNNLGNKYVKSSQVDKLINLAVFEFFPYF